MKNYVRMSAALFLIVLTVAASCTTYTVKDSKDIQKVDKKILEEFNTHIKEEQFYDACSSYIEFMNCCSNDEATKAKMIDSLTRLYEKRRTELENEGDIESLLEYTASFIRLLEWEKTEHEASILEYKKQHDQYVQRFIISDLSNKGELEKASWLIYLTHITQDNPHAYRELAEIFLQRGNALLADKYFQSYASLVEKGEGTAPPEDFVDLENRLKELEKGIAQQKTLPSAVIENAVKSSVKILVDKGIKTERGVGMPDQVMGTGVIIDERGYIITNYHIIESKVDPKYEGYSRVYAIPGDDEDARFIAKVMGYDRVYDLALLKIEKEMESRIQVGDSDLLKQGDEVVAIGNPVGLTNTVTSGVVSSKKRPFLQIGSIIQIDAALNPGNSGGALINRDGFLVGISFAGLRNFESLNFAIPANHMLSILSGLYEGGEFKRSWIGCSADEQEDGLRINYSVPNSPADVSGLRKGDIIKAVNGISVSKLFDVQRNIVYFKSPSVIRLTLIRNGREVERALLLEERPVFPALYIYDHDAYENIITPLFGIEAVTIDSSRKKYYTVKSVIKGSVASEVGISEGDTIRIRAMRFDEENRVFSLYIELKSKRFGYLDKDLVLYSYIEANNFV